MTFTYKEKLSNRIAMHLSYTKSLIEVLNELDENNAYKDTKRFHALLSDSHWLRAKIDILHQEIEYLEIKMRGETKK